MAILVDSSQWIRLLWKGFSHKLPEQILFQLHTCPPIIQEVVQGLRSSKEGQIARNQFLSFPIVADPVPLELYLNAADIYATGRRKGYTIRSSVDCLIAAIALKYELSIWHDDRDFDSLAKFTSLEIFST